MDLQDKTIHIAAVYSNAANGVASVIRTLIQSAADTLNCDVLFVTLDEENDSFENHLHNKVISNKSMNYQKLLPSLRRFFFKLADKSIFFLFFLLYFYFYKNSGRCIAKISSIKSNNNFIVHDVFTLFYISSHRPELLSRCFLILHCDGDVFGFLADTFSCLDKVIYRNAFDLLYKPIIMKISGVVFLNNEARTKFSRLGYTSKSTQIIHNGVRPFQYCDISDEIKISRSIYTFHCAGTICQRKGQLRLIRALHSINITQDKNFAFNFYGDGDDYLKCIEFIKRNNIHNVTFHGHINSPQRFYRNTDFFVLPSVNEGFPISCIEAGQLGLFILMTNINSHHEISSFFKSHVIDSNVNFVTDIHIFFQKIISQNLIKVDLKNYFHYLNDQMMLENYNKLKCNNI